MKRTKNINKTRFRKKQAVYRSCLLFTGVLGASLFLMGCDETTTTQKYLDRPFTDAYDCYKNSDLSFDKCDRAQNDAIRDAQANRKFTSREECLKDNPDNDCRTSSGSHGAYFYPYPHYYGYNAATGSGQAFYQGRNSSGFRSSHGSVFSPKTSSVPRTYTVTRGGFGSSFSSHASSSHSSFGG